MSIEKTVETLKEIDPEQDDQFIWSHKKYTRDLHIKTFIEKLFDTKIKTCYTSDVKHPGKNHLRWGCSTLILFMESGKIVELANANAYEKAKLIHTLTHEFGHAMGMEHVKNSDAIMYPSTTSKLILTDEDRQLLDYACRKQSRFKKILYDFNGWIYEKVEGLT